MASGTHAAQSAVRSLIEADFTRVDQDEVHAGNLVSSRVEPATLEYAGNRIHILPVPLLRARDLPLPEPAIIYAELDGAPVIIAVSRRFLDLLTTSIEPGLDLADLPRAARALIIEHVLSPYLEQAENAGFPRTQMHEIDLDPVMPARFDFAATISLGDGSEWPLFIGGAPTIIGRLVAYARQLPPRPLALESLPLLARFRIGYTVLRREDLMALRRGDGIMFDHSVLRQHKVIAIVGERFAQTCTVSSNGLKLSGPLNTPAPADLRGYCMSEQFDPTANDPAYSLASMPMKLVFELGRVEINLGELRHLGEGHVFELNKTRAQSVDLVVSGHIVGTGEIVRIGEGLGIRVMTIVEP